MPSIGTFVAESASSVVYGAKVVVNFISNPFAINEILVNRAEGLCPAASLNHGALMDCGMSLFALDDMFSSIYSANIAFWDIVAWIASLLRPNSANAVQGYFESFLTGLAAYGEAAHIVSLYEVCLCFSKHLVRIIEECYSDAGE